MRKTFIQLLIVLYCLLFCALLFVFIVQADEITLQWDTVDDVDGYRIYQRTGDNYNFEAPVTTVVYPDGNIPADVDRIIIDLPGVTGVDTKYNFVARAYRGTQESGNSNEVEYVVELTPPLSPDALQGSYDQAAGMILLSWAQPAGDIIVTHWIVYYRVKGAETWIAIGRINSDHELTMQAPIDAVTTGDRATLEFVVVAYRATGAYSENSNILEIDVDRREVPPVHNLRVNIEIPII